MNILKIEQNFIFENISLSYSLYFFSLIICTYFLSFVCFLFGLSISSLLFIISIAVSGFSFFLFVRQHCTVKYTIFHLFCLQFILLLFIIVSVYFFDTSNYGLWYHQPAIVKLANGWSLIYNPIYETNQYDKCNYLWIQHYPKLTWIIAACVYKTTVYLESGKAINFIMIATVFFYSLYVLHKLIPKKQLMVLLFSLLINLNPIAVSQLFSNYVDGFLSGVICLIILSIIQLNIANSNIKWNWFILLASIVLVTNINFTGLYMGGIIIGISSFLYWYKKEPFELIAQKYFF